MRNIGILLISVLILSCEKYAETLPLTGNKLVAIEYNYDGEKWSEKFSYDSSGTLIEINQAGRLKYGLEYSGEFISQILVFDTDENEPDSRDSLVYNLDGLLLKIVRFDLYPDEPSWTHEYEYDLSGNMIMQKAFHHKSGEYGYTSRYYWENGNIIHEEGYDGNGELSVEHFYKYDDKINFTPQIPYMIFNTAYWNENNMIEVDWKEYNICLYATCRPCYQEYDYNLEGYPVKSSGDSWKRTIFYKS